MLRNRKPRCTPNPTFSCKENCPIYGYAQIATDRLPQEMYDAFVGIEKQADNGDFHAQMQRGLLEHPNAPFMRSLCRRLNP